VIHIPLSLDPIKDAEARKKIGDIHRGKPKSEEHKRKIALAHKGIKASEETKKKLSEIRKGRKLSEEHKKKLGESHIGSHRSEETKLKMSLAAKGKIFTEEHRQNLSKAQKGNPLRVGVPKSEEFKEKLSKILTGKERTPEHCKRISEAKKGVPNPNNAGEKNPMWKGGISFEPYCPKFTRAFKERVRAYFDYICPECLTPQNGTKLHVHHVNFDKMTCCNDAIPLFVPLCQSCHSKTKFNREYWEQYFTDMIEQYYEGKCYFTQEEMKHAI
jgi:hypothetical protein